MSAWILLVSFVLVATSTMTLFWWIGIKPNALVFSKADADAFRRTRSPAFLWFMVSATIFTTLTSLATVYVFFIGSSKLFGAFVMAAPISIALSSFVTVALTQRILCNKPDFKALLDGSDRTSGVVARIIWSNDRNGQAAARAVKWISLINISSVLWLEFSVFGDLAGSMLPPLVGGNVGQLGLASAVVAFAVFCVFYLLLTYGLRGFVVADVLHSPFVLLSAVAALLGIYIAYAPQPVTSPAFAPLIPQFDVILFVLHVFALNLVFVLLTEGHWFRLWLFDRQENRKQLQGTLVTGLTWMFLGIGGCLAVAITPSAGMPGFVPVMAAIQNASPALAMLFWIGASAAIFSVADAQIYNFMIVKRFDAVVGEVDKKINRPARPLISAAVAAAAFALIYAVTRYLHIPFEKLVFVLFPFCLNILPAFLSVAYGKTPDVRWVYLSVVLYIILSVFGLFREDLSLAANLAAALVPVVVSLFALATGRPLATTAIAGEAGNES